MIGATIEVSRHPAQGTGIGVDGLVTHALKFQGPEMLVVELVESALCGWFHVKILVIPAPNWARGRLHEQSINLPRSAALCVFPKMNMSDKKKRLIEQLNRFIELHEQLKFNEMCSDTGLSKFEKTYPDFDSDTAFNFHPLMISWDFCHASLHSKKFRKVKPR